MTSANFSGQPIIKENGEAIEKLATITDGFLLHNRDIHVHCDDSVVRIFGGVELPVRRSRGYAPLPVKLPFALKPTLAVGGELKSTFCLAAGEHAFMSQHIGDMENLETLEAFEGAVAHMRCVFRIEPALTACDLHPAYLSTRWAESIVSKERASESVAGESVAGESVAGESVAGESVAGESVASDTNCSAVELAKIQHHHAHIASVMAEHGLGQDKRVIGFAFDGTGYGTDGAIWGGEVLNAGYADFERLAHLAYVPLPGGDGAIKKPYRMALAHLWAAGVEWKEDLPPVAACSPTERHIIVQQLDRRINTVDTSSMGRLFDAVAALAGIGLEVTYEAQAAIEFESLADLNVEGSYSFDLLQENCSTTPLNQPRKFSAAPVINGVVADLQQGLPPAIVSTKFHRAVAALILSLAQQVREAAGLNLVALSGGVFQNVLLLRMAVELLENQGFVVLTHHLVPSNDGGLALGQAVVANTIKNRSL